MQKIALETGISLELGSRVAIQELKLKPYKLQRVQLLTAENKRLERYPRLFRRVAPLILGRILFTDEQLFAIEQAHNYQNDRSWCAEASGMSAIVEHRQNPKSVVVSAGICATGKAPLVFVDEGVKIGQNVYHRDILDAVVVLWARRHFGRQQWTLDFITSAEWPPYSPDLNHMDYSIWSIL